MQNPLGLRRDSASANFWWLDVHFPERRSKRRFQLNFNLEEPNVPRIRNKHERSGELKGRRIPAQAQRADQFIIPVMRKTYYER